MGGGRGWTPHFNQLTEVLMMINQLDLGVGDLCPPAQPTFYKGEHGDPESWRAGQRGVRSH